MKKAILKRAFSGLLALLFVVMLIPATTSEVSAGDYTGCMIQHEPRWASYYVNGGSLSGTGCGIFSLVNCVGYLTGKTMDVIEVAEWAHDIGSFNVTYGGDGTYRLALYPKVQAKYGSKYGFTVDCGSDNEGWWDGSYSATLRNHVSNGGVAIGHVPGHFIAIVGYEGGKYHLYESSPSDARGTNYNGGDVWVTPAQLATGRLCLDWFCLLSATEKDTTNPVISDISITEVSASGYTINCIVKDDFYIDRVSFPTWTSKNGQDDLPAYFMTTQLGTRNGDMFSFRVNASAHNYETGEYNTHIYALDRGGNTTCYEINKINVRNDNQNPVITDVKVTKVSSLGYTVTCKATDDWDVHKVAFPTWTANNGQDDLADYFMYTQLGTRNGDYFTFEVKASDHNNETGTYITHIYAVDCSGNTVSYEVPYVNVGGAPSTDEDDTSSSVGGDTSEKEITLVPSSNYELSGTLLKNVKEETTVDALVSHLENKGLKAFNKSGTEIGGSTAVGTGAVIKLYSGSIVIDSVTVIVLGDIDGNAIIDATDYLRIKATFLNNSSLSSVEEAAADIDGGSSIDATDYVRIKSHFLGTYNLLD